MLFHDLLMASATQGGDGPDGDVKAWVAAVVAAGGTVSAGRQAIVTTFVAAEKTSGAWYLTDDYWENAPQALTSLKQRRLATTVNSPTFTADRGYAGDGATSYVSTGFAPFSNAVAMTGTSMRAALYERTDAAAGAGVGATNALLDEQSLLLRARAGTVMQGRLNSLFVDIANASSIGSFAFSRSGSTFTYWKNGSSLGTVVPGVITTGALTTRSLFIGALNLDGAAASWCAGQLGLVAVGAALSSGQELAQYNAVQAWATSIGANI